MGGAEVQQVLIARHLAQGGYKVSFVTRDHGQLDAAKVGGITVYKAFQIEAGLPYLRFFKPRLTGIWSALRRADADIYYQRCAGMETGFLAAFCRYYNKKMVFASGSDTDFDLKCAIISNWRDRWLYSYGLQRTDAIVAQTETQRELLKKNFGFDAHLIPNCWAKRISDKSQANNRSYVLWVSTLRRWKRPELFIDLAEILPNTKFVMVGGAASGEEAFYKQITKRAMSISNISFIGFVPFHEVGRYFDDASIVVNTSAPKEGFPNTFLQAWCRGIPVISFFDPDGLIRRFQLGFSVNNPIEMLAAVTKLLNDVTLYRKTAQAVENYFEANHSIGILGQKYEALFAKLMG